MGKVAKRILKEANEKKEEIIKKTRESTKSIKDKAKKEAREIEKRGEEKAERARKREMERVLSHARMELSTRKLEEKNKIMDKLKEEAKKEIKALKWQEEYKPFIKDLIEEACESKDEEIIPGSLYMEKVKELIKSFNKKKGYNFKIAGQKPDFEVGVILIKDKKRVNATLPILLDETIDKLEEEIVKLLFGSE